jgi:Tfp pilus assembly protein PilZ
MDRVILIGIIITLAVINVILLLAVFKEKLGHKKKRRKYVRLPVHIVPESFHIDGKLDVMLQNKAMIRNIGVKGLAIESDCSIKIKNKVMVKFILPETNKHIEVKGCVVWVGKDFHESVVGIKFTKIKRENEEHIKKFIEAKVGKARC